MNLHGSVNPRLFLDVVSKNEIENLNQKKANVNLFLTLIIQGNYGEICERVALNDRMVSNPFHANVPFLYP